MQGRDKKGRFSKKSDTGRYVKSIRVSKEDWAKFGDMASQRGITRADLLSEWINDDQVIHEYSEEAIKILEEALKLKANAGGAIKKRIRHFLSLVTFSN